MWRARGGCGRACGGHGRCARARVAAVAPRVDDAVHVRLELGRTVHERAAPAVDGPVGGVVEAGARAEPPQHPQIGREGIDVLGDKFEGVARREQRPRVRLELLDPRADRARVELDVVVDDDHVVARAHRELKAVELVVDLLRAVPRAAGDAY
eukprot:3243506-Prymnesium_polylepis.1